ncbi:MAG TPA: autotransporter outer membrane beta-barrel domain-containing protein, partial [Alphaproteobacteria bacterium]|nr:autotransporter outer membrane beta-barrel domain-containing protein [Alphaproteobacteria bacterium]
WTQSSGIEPLKDVLTSKGVDMTNWVIDSAEDISADGTLIVGRAKLSGQQKAYIANLASAGITTPESLSTSLYGVSKIAQQVSTYANYYNQQGLFLSRHISELSVPISSSSLNKASYLNSMKPAAGNEAIPIITKRNLSTFALGGYGVGNNNDFDNNEWSGIAGINLTLDGNKSLSLGIIKGQSIYDIDSDGSSVLSTLGAIGTITYTPKQSNIRIYGTVFGVNLELDTNRGYINGSGLDFSKGSTEGFSYGSATRLGWEMSLPNNITIIMPYIEGHYSRTKINGYQENGGAFSANFTELDSENISSHVGIEINQEITPTLELIVRSAWGHKVSGEEGQITANVSGIMQNMNWDAGNTNWAETTIGASWEATPDLHIATEVTGRSGSVSQPAAHINIGAKYKF